MGFCMVEAESVASPQHPSMILVDWPSASNC